MDSELNKNQLDAIFESLVNTRYKYDDILGITYLDHNQFKLIQEKMSLLRRNRYFKDSCEYHKILDLFRLFYKKSIKRKELIRLQPRIIAQKFIGKKKIRDFIFKRDAYKCLKCGSNERLQLDHIVPISKNGENKLSNLQTLCASCNSIKKDNYFDYRTIKKK